MSLLINLKNITKIYFSGNHIYPILKDICFSVDEGEMIAIVGSSGSGKSTLMNILGLLDRCTQGNYFFKNDDVSTLCDEELSNIRNKKIGFIFQSFFLLPRWNVLNNVMLPLFYRKEPEETGKNNALQVLEKVDMQQYAYHRPNQLSGGQQQRVAIARALVTNPHLILADEPTGSLDSVTSQDIMELFIHLNKIEKRTIIIVTHDKKISQLCQRTIEIKDGRLLDTKEY